jgi:hypothetical protein
MSDSYEIFPKIPTPGYSTVFKNKVPLDCTLCSEVNFDDDLHKDQNLHVPVGTILFYVEDVQFYAMSKPYKQPMSAWIRMHFITNDKRSLWYTVVCSTKRVWDFETYRRRVKLVKEAMNENFELLISGDDDFTEQENLIEMAEVAKTVLNTQESIEDEIKEELV